MNEKNICGVYRITSPSNKIYIGQSINILQRFKSYRKKFFNQIKLYNSFLKYGVESHAFEIIEECDIAMLDERELFWQLYYQCKEKGLNCVYTVNSRELTYLKLKKRAEQKVKLNLMKEQKKEREKYLKVQKELVLKTLSQVLQ